MITYYLIATAIGCGLAVIIWQFIRSKKLASKNKKIKQLTDENQRLNRENFEYKTEIVRNRNRIDKLEDRMEAVEYRQDQADQWFGSVIRHSRAQFSKEAVEAFLEEHGMKEEE